MVEQKNNELIQGRVYEIDGVKYIFVGRTGREPGFPNEFVSRFKSPHKDLPQDKCLHVRYYGDDTFRLDNGKIVLLKGVECIIYSYIPSMDGDGKGRITSEERERLLAKLNEAGV